MRIFVTGASGFIGSAVVPELLGAGHEVVGLARSDASAGAISATGAEVLRGGLEDLDSLRKGAAEADGVIHLAFIHDFDNYAAAVQADLGAIGAIGATLEGSGRPLVIASGLAGLAPGRPAVESDMPDPSSPRAGGAAMTLGLAERGVRSSVLRLPPTVHGKGDKGFVPRIIAAARSRGTSSYIGEGTNCWSAVHRLDAARLFRLAVEGAPAGSVLHATEDVSVPTRTIAEVIGRHLGLPVDSISAGEATEHLGFIGFVFSLDASASSEQTRQLLGWQPTHPDLLEDLAAGHYFE